MGTLQDRYKYVIVGAGMAGASAVEAIRERDPDGTIALLGAEGDPPVYRPDLSKTLWLEDESDLDSSQLLDEHTAPSWHADVTATALDPAAHTVRTDQGEVRYERLLLATGGQPRDLGIAPSARVIDYRTVADYRALRAVATPGAHVIVVGGGFIGAEIAAALTQNHVTVTLVLSGRLVQEHMFPRELAERITADFERRGVRIEHGRVSGGSSDDDAARILLEDGRQLDADAVVIGAGVTPRTGLAEAAGLEVSDGIVVDDHLRTTAPDVYAAGDVVSYPDALLGRRRVEHADAAESMGQCAGANMAGEDQPYLHTPFFWSDLFEDGYEAIGRLDASLTTVLDWNDGHTAAVVYYLDAGSVVGVLLWNTWDSVPKAEHLIRETTQHPVQDPQSLMGRIEVG